MLRQVRNIVQNLLIKYSNSVLILHLSGFNGMCWYKPRDKSWIPCYVRSYGAKLCITFFGGLVNLSMPCRLFRLHIFVPGRNFMTFTLLLIAILNLFNKSEYTVNDNDIFNCILNCNLTSFLDSFFSWCLLSNLYSMIILP